MKTTSGTIMIRNAAAADVPAMHRVRNAVRENRLSPGAIGEAEYIPEIEATGRGWVVVEQDVLPGMGAPKESAARNRAYLRTIGL